MTTVPVCRCGHTEGAHRRGICGGLTRYGFRCDCQEYVPADGQQVVLL